MELYKKYRPKTLARVVGNVSTINALQSMLAKGELPHTILFSGPSGCGKTTLARILVRELGCTGMDFCELNCSDVRGIDTIREINEQMRFAPMSKCKVYLLDEVHKITNDAQNAALKILEDTPKHVYFFLCTTDPQKIIATVRNRCTQMHVATLSVSEMSALVMRVMKRENIELPESVKLDIIDRAEGSPRVALVLLDKIRNVEPSQYASILESRMQEEGQAIDLCRALLDKRTDWRKISSVLTEIRSSSPDIERVRYAILGYATSVLLKDGNNTRARAMLAAFEHNLYDGKFFGLVLRCREVYDE